MPFSINGREIGSGHKPYFVAELSGNHNNEIERAFKLIDAAKDAGADAVKLQTYTASTITIDHHSDEFIVKEGLWKGRRLFDLYTEASTPWGWHKQLFEHANNIGITIFSAPFDFTAVDFLEELDSPAYKIASPELIDLPLINKVCKTKKPIIISTGASSISEISETISFIKSKGIEKIILLHCTAAYPAPLKEANLSTIQFFKKKFNVDIGLSDHTLGIVTASTAVSLGACLIEKHLTLSRDEGGVDSAFSLEPSEFSSMVKNSLDSYYALGTPQETPTASESNVQKNRRSLYVVKNIKKGEPFTEKNIRSIRPSLGIKPKYYFDILGKNSTRDISFGEPLREDMILNFNTNKISLFKEIGNILITSSSNKNPLIKSIKKSLMSINQELMIFAGDSNEKSLSKYDADFFWNMPKTEEENLDKILSFCKMKKIRFIFPTRDSELFFWSKHKLFFKSHDINIMVAEKAILEICLDKLLFFKFCKNHNFPAVPTTDNIETLKADNFVVKERYGSGSRNIGLNLNKNKAIEYAKKLDNPIFQPYIKSKEVSIDSWVSSKGFIPLISARERNLVIDGESKVTTTFKNDKIENEIKHFIEKLNIRGSLVVQAFLTNGKLELIECNPRVGGASTISMTNGLDIFVWSILESINPDFYPKVNQLNQPITQIRTQIDQIFYDFNF